MHPRESRLDRLTEWFSRFDSCLVAFSSGVDSSVLAFASHKVLGNRAIAATSVSPAFAEREILSAKKMAEEIGIELVIVSQDDLNDEKYVENSVARCYFCRRNLTAALYPVAKTRNIEVCVDGTQMDDLRSPRPGIKSLREAGFRAPLVELSYSKEDVREMARCAGLSNSERPSEACLSSRIAFEQRIDYGTLQMIEKAEEFIKNLSGADIVRVRTFQRRALVEVDGPSVNAVLGQRKQIVDALRLIGYSEVEIDPEGYKQGRMLFELSQRIH
jgi:uncharacterized protein